MQRFVLPGLRSIFHKRNSYIEQRLRLAEEQTLAAEKIHAGYEHKMAEAKKIHANLINETNAKVRRYVESTLASLDKKLSEDLHRKEARKNLAWSAKALENMSVSLAIEFIGKVSSRQVTKKDLLKYIN
jgi:F0F1-type ATP synthase membrane subunit b/b'